MTLNNTNILAIFTLGEEIFFNKLTMIFLYQNRLRHKNYKCNDDFVNRIILVNSSEK